MVPAGPGSVPLTAKDFKRAVWPVNTKQACSRLTLTAVHLVTVEASKGLGPTGQTHWPRASSFLDTGHHPTQTTVHQSL